MEIDIYHGMKLTCVNFPISFRLLCLSGEWRISINLERKHAKDGWTKLSFKQRAIIEDKDDEGESSVKQENQQEHPTLHIDTASGCMKACDQCRIIKLKTSILVWTAEDGRFEDEKRKNYRRCLLVADFPTRRLIDDNGNSMYVLRVKIAIESTSFYHFILIRQSTWAKMRRLSGEVNRGKHGTECRWMFSELCWKDSCWERLEMILIYDD